MMQRIQAALESARMCTVLLMLDDRSHHDAETVGKPQRRVNTCDCFGRQEAYSGARPRCWLLKKCLARYIGSGNCYCWCQNRSNCSIALGTRGSSRRCDWIRRHETYYGTHGRDWIRRHDLLLHQRTLTVLAAAQEGSYYQMAIP